MNEILSQERQDCLMNSVIDAVRLAFASINEEACRPSAVFRPRIGKDGNKWIAIYGDNIQEGVCGCGDSPLEAMRAFDDAWFAKVAP